MLTPLRYGNVWLAGITILGHWSRPSWRITLPHNCRWEVPYHRGNLPNGSMRDGFTLTPSRGDSRTFPTGVTYRGGQGLPVSRLDARALLLVRAHARDGRSTQKHPYLRTCIDCSCILKWAAGSWRSTGLTAANAPRVPVGASCVPVERWRTSYMFFYGVPNLR